MRKFVFLSSVIFLSAFVRVGFAQAQYDTYANARFEYQIEYPSAILIPQPEADNGDGRVFLSRDKTAEMRVWGEYNALSDTLKKAYLGDLKERPDGITYKAFLKNSYVISGTDGDKIFYQKTILKGKDGDSGAAFATFRIEYHKSDKAKFDAVVQRISKSFRFN